MAKNKSNPFSQFDEQDTQSAQAENEFARWLKNSESSLEKEVKVGDRLQVEVLSIGKEEIFVSTGTQHDGVLLRSELKPEELPKVGDSLSVFVTRKKDGQIYVSTRPTAKNIAEDLEDAYDMMLPVEGKVTEVCNGGVRVQILGKTAFCPLSQLDLRKVDRAEDFVGKKFQFKITQFSEKGRNIVVSRRKLLEEERELSEASFFEDHKEGDLLKGKVTRIEKFGCFVEVAPGLEGLVHISEISWSHLTDPHEACQIGQNVDVKILKMEGQGNLKKISLSIKQAGSVPWDSVILNIGDTLDGRVSRCAKFGAFVEVAPGVEGLVPMSEMSYTRRANKAEDFVNVGDRVRVVIKSIDRDNKRLGLSLKEAGSDPWDMVPVKFPVGSQVKAIVEKREPYGLFFRLDEGIIGLLPKSKTKDFPDFPFERLKPKDEALVMVDEVNMEDRKISLGPPREIDDGSWKSVQGANARMGTLGDQFKHLFQQKNK